jgi:DUF438 domain-containing protein
MDAITKDLVRNTLTEFKDGSEDQKKFWIEDIKRKLKVHEDGLKYIGMGNANYYVKAARIFLRIQRDKTINNET